MSPSTIRRYRAERLLRQEFELQRARVLANVRARLRAASIRLDEGDLDACYAQAWHGLYAALLEGEDVANPTAWLTLVTYRRAIDEHRACGRANALRKGAARHPAPELMHAAPARTEPFAGGPGDCDFAADMDDRAQIRHLFEGLRARLASRELQAAELCYLHGLTRSDAARVMGVSDRGMRKLMEGRGKGRPGAAGKVSALVQSIRDGAWCDEQASLMRGFAYGMLDHSGERYRLARDHLGSCPACRAYVASLRGLAVLLPPPLLPLLRLAGGSSAGAGPLLGAAHGAPLGRGGALANSASSGPADALSTSAGASTGAAGGSWLLAGGPAAKLAAGCVLALGVGAGCVSLTPQPAGARHARHGAVRRPSAPGAHAGSVQLASALLPARAPSPTPRSVSAMPTPRPTLSAGRMATREFGPEQAGASGAPAAAPHLTRTTARAASVSGPSPAPGSEFSPAAGAGAAPNAASSAQSAEAGSAAGAQREFAPG